MTVRQVGRATLSERAFFACVLVCPECGCTRFGSERRIDGRMIRHCHGWVGEGRACTIAWPIEDDDRYSFLPLSFVIETKGDI
jgi:hypothetical protein